MDAVKRSVESMGGTLEIDSEKGRGTRFTLRLPLTVAVVNLLLVAVGEEIFGLPIAKVQGAVEAEPDQLSKSRGAVMMPYGGSLLEVYELSQPPSRGDSRKIEDDGNAAEQIVEFLAEKRLV